MESGKKVAGVVAVMLLVLELMVAPTTMAARSLQQDTSPVLALSTIAREFSYADGAIFCGETCVFLPCATKVIGCKCRNKRICVR
ncbi:unnamed protein product [Urochloa decumbens]|uniref:Uncharacterized protein n=1 Tax=Urochloa decumbens TaxID=240449 RepID=A0ABC8WBM9_9POAL